MSPTFRLLFFSVIRTVAAWAAERATHDATQIGVASGYLHHKSLGVPPQSWRHVDHPRWTLGPTICWLLVQLTLLHSTAMDIFYARVPELHWWSKLGFPSLLSVPSPRILSFPYSCCSSTENLYPPPSNFCFLRFFFFFFFLYLKRSSSICVWLLDSYFLIIFLICSPSILLSRHGALTVNVEPESTDSTTQVLHSFLQMCSQWMDTKN